MVSIPEILLLLLTMTNLKFLYPFLILLFISFLGTNNRTSAQFINIQIIVEPELTAKVEQELRFGNIVSNSGLTDVDLGDTNMGIFSIKALYTQSVYIELNFPDFLENTDPAFDDTIPLFLEIAYNNSGVENIRSSKFLTNNEGFISIYEPSNEGAPKIIWQDLYLYIFGSLDIGNIPNGIYEGEVQLIVYYD